MQHISWHCLLAALPTRLACGRYDEELRATLEAAPLVGDADEAGARSGDVRLQYDSQKHYEQLAAGFGLLQVRLPPPLWVVWGVQVLKTFL